MKASGATKGSTEDDCTGCARSVVREAWNIFCAEEPSWLTVVVEVSDNPGLVGASLGGLGVCAEVEAVYDQSCSN